MSPSDDALRKLIHSIVTGDTHAVSQLLTASPWLAAASFQSGASRQDAKKWYVKPIERYIFAGDTALHFAAAAYRQETILILVNAGADVSARNRNGDQPLHSAAVGIPGSSYWNPSAQAESIACLIEAGADPNAVNKHEVTPLHRAVRTRCAAAVRTLLRFGADPDRRNKSGSTPLTLASLNTGRGGTGSPEAKSQQQEILTLLKAGSQPTRR